MAVESGHEIGGQPSIPECEHPCIGVAVALEECHKWDHHTRENVGGSSVELAESNSDMDLLLLSTHGINVVSVEQLAAIPMGTEFGSGCLGDSMAVAMFLVITDVDMIK